MRGHSRTRGLVLASLIAGSIAAPARGQEVSEGTSEGAWRTGGVGSVFVQGGKFGLGAHPQLPELLGGGTWGLGLSFFPGPPFPGRAIGVDFHVWGVSRSYASLVEGAADPSTELSTQAFALGGRAGLPVAWPVGVSLLGGFTYVEHVMKVRGQPAWFLPGVGQTWQEEDGGWAPYWGFAGQARFGAIAMGVEKRWVDTAGTFDDPFSLTDVDLGGSALLVTLTWYSGR